MISDEEEGSRDDFVETPSRVVTRSQKKQMSVPVEEERDSFDDPMFDESSAQPTVHTVEDEKDSFDEEPCLQRAPDPVCSSPSADSRDSSKKDVDATMLSSILEAVITNKTFTSKDVARALTICIRADDDMNLDPVARVLSRGLGLLMANQSADAKGVSTVFYFLAKLAVKGHLHGCELPFAVIRQEVEGFVYSEMCWARVRCCQLIVNLLQVSGEEGENDEQDDPESETHDSNPTGGCIPSGILIQWSSTLCQRRLDKDPHVRSAALRAIARLPMSRFFDHNGKLVTSNKLLMGSLRDDSWDVRETVISLLSITSPTDVDVCLQFMTTEQNVTGRLTMANRLVHDVHINSMTGEQRVRFIQQLQQDPDQVVQSVLSCKLVPRWLDCLGEMEREAATMEDDDWETDEPEDDTLPAYPLALLQYIDLFNNETLLTDLMRFALSHYMEAAVGSRTDGAAFLEFLRHMSPSQRERAAVLHRKTVQTEIEAYGPSLARHLFMHRCLVELMASIHRSSSQLAQMEHVMSRLMPNMHTMAGILKSFCIATMSETSSAETEFCVRQMCYMLRCLDRGCAVGLASWLGSLSYLAGNASIFPSETMVEFAVLEILEYVIRGLDKIEEVSASFCYRIGELLGGEDDEAEIPDPDRTIIPSQLSQRQAASLSSQQYTVLHRCATLLHALISYAAITSLTPLMRNVFNRMVEPLSLAPTATMRSLGCRLVGLAACLDDITLQQRCAMLRHAIEIDIDSVKAVALTALTDVVCCKDFKLVARWSFPELAEDDEHARCMADMVEQLVHTCPVSIFPGVCKDALRLMYKSCTNWPTLIAALLCRFFDRSKSSGEEALDVFSSFCKGFVDRGMAGSLQLLSGFLSAIDRIDSVGLPKVSIGQMTSFVCGFFATSAGKPAKTPRKNKKTSSSSEEKDTLEAAVSIDLLLGNGLLRRIAARSEGISACGLATASLTGINIDRIPPKHLCGLRDLANAVVKKLSVDSTQKKLIDGVSKFLRAIDRSIKNRGCGEELGKTAARVKLENDELEGPDVDSSISHSLRQKCRLGRGDGNSWGRVKDEPLDEDDDEMPPSKRLRPSSSSASKVKLELDEVGDTSTNDVYQIEDDDSDVVCEGVVFEPVVKKPRRSRASGQEKRASHPGGRRQAAASPAPIAPVIVVDLVSSDDSQPCQTSDGITIVDPLSSDRDLSEPTQHSQSPDIFSD